MADLWKTLGYDQIALEVARGLSENSDIWVVKGPPGVGKSWLAKGIAAMWEAAGGGSAVAEGDPMKSHISLYPFGIPLGSLPSDSDLLRPALGTLGKTSEVLLGTGGLLTTTVEALSALHRKSKREQAILLDQAEQDVLFKLAKLGKDRPLLLVADNLHWWDPGSLDFLNCLRDPRLSNAFPFLTKMRVLGVETTEPYQSIAHPDAHTALLSPQVTHAVCLNNVPRKGFEDVLLALGAPDCPTVRDTDLIHKFSGGHLVLAGRCAERLGSSEAEGFLAAEDTADFVRRLLGERLRSLGKVGEEVVGLLRVAAVSGLTFRRDGLLCAVDADESETLRLLRHCRKEDVLELQQGVGRFVHDLYRQYFLETLGEERFAIHEALAECLRKLSPGDYESRCINAREAERDEEAAALAAQAALQRQREAQEWRSLPGAILDAIESEGFGWVIERFETAIDHAKSFRTENCLEVLAGLPHDLPRRLMAEADYTRATALMTTRSEQDRAEAEELLAAWSDYVEEEPELGLRLMRLRIYAMAMQVNKEPGRKLEGRLRQILGERASFDPAAKDALYALDRCAGSMYPPKRATPLLKRAAEHFQPEEGESVVRRPVEYYLCLLNLGANLISRGSYETAAGVHRKLEELVSRYEPGVFPRVDYARINALLCDYRRGSVKPEEAVSRQREIAAAHRIPHDPFHVENAYACYTMFAGAYKDALCIFDGLADELKRRSDLEPSMVYLVRANRCAARYVAGEVVAARDEWESLTGLTNAIPYATRTALIHRHERLAEVIARGKTMSAQEFDECLLSDVPHQFESFWSHHGRGFRLPAIQWWRAH